MSSALTLLDMESDLAFAKLDEANGNIEALSEPYKTIVIIYSAQGIIDNGGLVYFFEADWPNNPPYELFVDAYHRIGADEAANAIEQALGYFKVENPEQNQNVRLEFLQSLPKEYSEHHTNEFLKLEDFIVGNEMVWKQLEDYVFSYKSSRQ